MKAEEVLRRQTTPKARSASELRRLARRGDFIVTAAQNNTPPEPGFFEALKVFAEHRKAELLVIPIRYKNPTSAIDPSEATSDPEDYWWHSDFLPHLLETDVQVHEGLWIMGGWRIQATSRDPLGAGMEAPSRGASAIYGHSQLTMRTVATPQHRLPKLLYSTGAATAKNYSETRMGRLADFHHSHSAIIVEVRGKRFHTREVTWDRLTQCFYDLDERFTPGGMVKSPGALALITGDEHVRFRSREVVRATYEGEDSIKSVLRPQRIVRHDVQDTYSVSPHHEFNSITRAVKSAKRRDSLADELDETLEFIESTGTGCENVIVSSNHHDHLVRWLRGPEPKDHNAALYHWFKWRILSEATLDGRGVSHPDPLALYARDMRPFTGDLTITFLGPDDSYQVLGIELGMHGHLGPNGARGNIRNLSRIGTRSVVGHSHTPGIYQGVYQVGTSSNLRLEYNAGPSSWLHCHCIIHPNGKRQMIPIIFGHWRG